MYNVLRKLFYPTVVHFIYVGVQMKCNLSRILGEKRLKISEVSRDTGIHRNTLTRLYKDTATRIEMDLIDQLCGYLEIELNELFELEAVSQSH